MISSHTLFSFLVLLMTIVLALCFLVWRKYTTKLPMKAKKPVRRNTHTSKATNVQQQKPAPAAAKTEVPSKDNEEFINYVSQIPSGWNPTYPTWLGASNIFARTRHDNVYEEYARDNLQPSQELIDLINSVPVSEDTVPNYGSELGTFDSGDLTSIPWDADNTQYLQKDVVWGTISRQASASIFLKVYHRNLLADADNLIKNDTNFQYHSPILDIATRDPVTTQVLQGIDATAAVVGQMGMDSASNAIKKANERALQKMRENKLLRGETLTPKEMAKHDSFIENRRNKDRLAKIKSGTALSAAEKAEQARYDSKNPTKLNLYTKVGKYLAKFSIVTKFIAGIKPALDLARRLITSMRAMMTRVLTKVLQKLGLGFLLTISINGAAFSCDGSIPFTFGATAIFCAIIHAIGVIWAYLDIISMIIMIMLQFILPTILDNQYAMGGVCPNGGKPLDQLIEDEFLYFMFTNFIPAGGVFEVFGPYICFNRDGSINMKTPLKIPPYFYDSTNSLYRRVYPAAQTPRGDKTSHTDPSASIPAGWTVDAGIAREPCDPGTWTSSPVDMLCNVSTYVPETYIKGSNIPRTTVKASSIRAVFPRNASITTYSKPGGYSGSCNPGDTDWTVFPLCTRKSCANPADDYLAGVCWQSCGREENIGALCRNRCDPAADDVGGVCWSKCGANQIDQGALCRDKCGGSTPHDVAGICWGGCGDDIDVGALCRKKCRGGFHEVAGVCWGDRNTYARGSMIPKSTKTYDPGYVPPSTPTLDYCNFASPEMMNRMAQFYYDQSSLHPEKLEDGRMSFQYIVGFYGVIASSELSCDVACSMKTIKFDPITGGKYEESIGAYYPEDPGNTVSYRRFYFIKNDNDDTGLFTVTACTNADYTSPDSQVKSSDPASDPVPSVPKIFDIVDKSTSPEYWFNATVFVSSFLSTVVSTGLGMVGGRFGMVGNVAGGVAGGMAGEAVSARTRELMARAVGPETSHENAIIRGSDDNFYISTNNDHYSINYGPIYEIRARDGSGYIPRFIFCSKVITTELLCSHPYILRDTIDTYHTQNPTKHVKTISLIEPRGRDGCYYKWSTVDYTPSTNTEGDVTTESEIVRRHAIRDTSTCVFSPTSIFVTDMTAYPVRSYFDTLSQTTIYPTRDVKSIPTVQGRYIRIRPSQVGGDGFLHISQIGVFDMTGTNLAKGKPVFATTTYSAGDGIAAPANTIVDGTLSARSGISSVWQPLTGNRQQEYIDIDLGMTYYINYIMYIGRLDCCSDRNMGVRVQVLFTNGENDLPAKELVTTTIDTTQVLDFTEKQTVAKLPAIPFKVPQPLPTEANLGDGTCPTRCQDKSQIESLVQQFNANPVNANSQILKVLKAITPTSSRCDYEVEMIRTAGGKKTVAKELISMAVNLTEKSADSGLVYGRYVRVLSAPNNILKLSQVVINNVAGTNIALRRPVYATSNYIYSETATVSGIASKITDGTTIIRTSPSYWSAEEEDTEAYIEIDLGQTQPISNIVLYGVAGGTYNGVKVQVLLMNGIGERPIYISTLTSDATEHTIKYNQCTFAYTTAPLGGSFIQDNTPLLSATDTSGGVLTFQTIRNKVASVFQSIIGPVNALDPLGVLNANVKAANTTAKNTLNAAAANIQLEGCPNTKCSDPAVLTSIMNRYNADNNTVSSQFGGETHTMSAILKAGVSGPNACDVLFTDLYNLYDDYLYPAVNTVTTTVAKRFVMANQGNCAMRVAYGVNSIIDVSMNTVGLIAPSSALTTSFVAPPCQVNCRDPAILSAIRQKINTQSATSTVISDFKTVAQSFANTTASCEYLMKKDITTKNTITNSFSTDTGIDTYVTASFTPDYLNCSFVLDAVTEFDPDLVTTRTDRVTGATNTFINGVYVDLPYLYNYDNTTPSGRVNETVKILS